MALFFLIIAHCWSLEDASNGSETDDFGFHYTLHSPQIVVNCILEYTQLWLERSFLNQNLRFLFINIIIPPSFKKNFTKENLSLYHQQQLISSIYGTYMHHARMESSIYLLTKVTFYRNLERGVIIQDFLKSEM